MEVTCRHCARCWIAAPSRRRARGRCGVDRGVDVVNRNARNAAMEHGATVQGVAAIQLGVRFSMNASTHFKRAPVHHVARHCCGSVLVGRLDAHVELASRPKPLGEQPSAPSSAVAVARSLECVQIRCGLRFRCRTPWLAIVAIHQLIAHRWGGCALDRPDSGGRRIWGYCPRGVRPEDRTGTLGLRVPITGLSLDSSRHEVPAAEEEGMRTGPHGDCLALTGDFPSPNSYALSFRCRPCRTHS